jgi:ubiquinone biosynthesis protein COQ4
LADLTAEELQQLCADTLQGESEREAQVKEKEKRLKSKQKQEALAKAADMQRRLSEHEAEEQHRKENQQQRLDHFTNWLHVRMEEARTKRGEIQVLLKKMLADEEGKAVLAARPRITSSILPELAALPPNTLGYHYQAFLAKHDITPDSRAEVSFVDCPDLAYVMTRYRETHDLTHCILGMPTTMVGEVAVKWVEAFQLGLPMCVGGAVLGPLRFGPKQREQYQKLMPWAVEMGKKANFLLAVHWEERWEQDFEQLRRELQITPAPSFT